MRRALVFVILLAATAAASSVTTRNLVLERTREAGRLELHGNVEVREVNLGFVVGGRIERVLVEEGDRVAPGQVLAELDAGYLTDTRNQLKSTLEAQTANLTRLKNGSRPEEVAQARAVVSERRANLEYATAELARQKDLVEGGGTSRQAFESARAAHDQAEAQLASAEAALRLAELGPRQEEKDQAGAQVSQARASLEQAERYLRDSKLVAPSAGIVQTRIREAGAYVNTGEPVYTLSLVNPIWVRTYVSEIDLGRVKPGARVDVRTDGNRSYSGTVGFISPVAEFTPKSVETAEVRTALVYRLRVVVEDDRGELRQGMPVTVHFDFGAGEPAPVASHAR